MITYKLLIFLLLLHKDFKIVFNVFRRLPDVAVLRTQIGNEEHVFDPPLRAATRQRRPKLLNGPL